MALKEFMTWQSQHRRWVKKLPVNLSQTIGKTFVSISCRQLGVPDTKDASRSAANHWWLAFLQNHSPTNPTPLDYWREYQTKMAAWYRRTGDLAAAEAIETQDATAIRAQRIDQMADEIVAHKLGLNISHEAAIWDDRISRQEATPERKISHQIKQFLAHKKGKISVGRLDNIKHQLERMMTYLGNEADISDLNSANLQGYFDHLTNVVELSDYAKRDTFSTAKQIIRHLVELDLIPMPGKLASKSLSFTVEVGSIETFELAELRRVFNSADEEIQLYMLLAMNCGFTQQDISDLVWERKDKSGNVIEKVDIKEGRIIRKRSKTAKHKAAPCVNYKLWDKTIDLLKKYSNAKSANVLTMKNGSALLKDVLTAEDKRSKTDNIGKWFSKISPQSFSVIRATSGTLLGAHSEYGKYAQFFLGHAPHSVADRHYIKPNQERFDAAVEWLGQEYLG